MSKTNRNKRKLNIQPMDIQAKVSLVQRKIEGNQAFGKDDSGIINHLLQQLGESICREVIQSLINYFYKIDISGERELNAVENKIASIIGARHIRPNIVL
jgi:hypothetical protein